MRKNILITLLIFILLLPTLVFAIKPAELTGKWGTKPLKNGKEALTPGRLQEYYTFDQDDKVTISVFLLVARNEDGFSVEIKLSTKMPGTYKIKGNTITLTCDYGDIEFKCDKEDIEVFDHAGNITPEIENEIKDNIMAMVHEVLVPQVKTLITENDQIEKWTNVTVNPTAISYEKDGRKLVLYRQFKGF